MERDEHWRRARENRVGGIVFVKGREEPDLVARVADGHHRHHHRLGRAARDDELALSASTGMPVKRVSFCAECMAQLGRTPGHRVLVAAGVHRILRRL